MVQPFDLSKFRKGITKSNQISHGFNDPKTWLSTGCYALNYLISNDFKGGIPLEGKFTMFAGDSGSGKSYLASANVVKDAQLKGVYPIIFDTENALDESWMKDLDVDTSPEMMMKISVAKIDDLAKTLGDAIDLYRTANDPLPYDQRAKLLFIIDSLGMLITENMEKQYEEGDQKGDLGIKAKQLTALLRVTLAKIASQPIGVIATNHVYMAQDKYKPDTISGGNMTEFVPSVIIQTNKNLLRVDENDQKLESGVIAGISASTMVRKSRYAKPFERVHIQIPYTTGMDPYSGLHDLFKGKGLLALKGKQWEYVSRQSGEVISEYRKNLKAKGVYDLIMEEKSFWDKEVVGEGFDHSGDFDVLTGETVSEEG